MEKYNVILHTTTFCNFNCSYCNVVKDNKHLRDDSLQVVSEFIKNNHTYIHTLKFFGGEPLLAFDMIKELIDQTHEVLGKKYEIVTNTTLLSDAVGEYFEKYFELIFFSIDSENPFDYEKVFTFIDSYKLSKKVFFNLIISPGKEEYAFEQFQRIYKRGYKNFNLLPVYMTKEWKKEDLLKLSKVIKDILDTSLLDETLQFFGFQKNTGYNTSLTYHAFFIDVDLKVYYSDIVSTHFGQSVKEKLFLGPLETFNFGSDIESLSKSNELELFEKNLIKGIRGQKELHSIMDYFSLYLNSKKGTTKD